jgi:hypothetical protein
MKKKGGDIFGLFNLGLWGAAAANSDGSVTNTIWLRFYYGLLILSPLFILMLLWLVFGKVTQKNHFEDINAETLGRVPKSH